MDIPEVAFTTDIQLRFSDTDQFRHINHATFLSHLEAARLNWFRSTGQSYDRTKYGGIMAHIEIDFMRPLTLDTQYRISLWISRLGNKSYTHSYILHGKRDDRTYVFAKAESVIVTYDFQKSKTIPIPSRFRSLLSEITMP